MGWCSVGRGWAGKGLQWNRCRGEAAGLWAWRQASNGAVLRCTRSLWRQGAGRLRRVWPPARSWSAVRVRWRDIARWRQNAPKRSAWKHSSNRVLCHGNYGARCPLRPLLNCSMSQLHLLRPPAPRALRGLWPRGTWLQPKSASQCPLQVGPARVESDCIKSWSSRIWKKRDRGARKVGARRCPCRRRMRATPRCRLCARPWWVLRRAKVARAGLRVGLQWYSRWGSGSGSLRALGVLGAGLAGLRHSPRQSQALVRSRRLLDASSGCLQQYRRAQCRRICFLSCGNSALRGFPTTRQPRTCVSHGMTIPWQCRVWTWFLESLCWLLQCNDRPRFPGWGFLRVGRKPKGSIRTPSMDWRRLRRRRAGLRSHAHRALRLSRPRGLRGGVFLHRRDRCGRRPPRAVRGWPRIVHWHPDRSE